VRATRLRISDVVLFEPKVFGDERGSFFESFSQVFFEEATGLKLRFVQDNQSSSRKDVLRGLHYQLPPKEQGKLVRAVQGEIFDVAVDIRQGSPTAGQWVAEILSAENRKQLWIPPGFAHGFVTLSETAVCLYKTTDLYSPEHERCIGWNDPEIGIAWPVATPILSAKDARAASRV
jgi:dTDP-4-dehydrorhamnose 3,5-epimerase